MIPISRISIRERFNCREKTLHHIHPLFLYSVIVPFYLSSLSSPLPLSSPPLPSHPYPFYSPFFLSITLTILYSIEEDSTNRLLPFSCLFSSFPSFPPFPSDSISIDIKEKRKVDRWYNSIRVNESTRE